MISVIIPVYNTEKYLKRCVDSFLNQTYKDFEIILVDDGSEDKSGQICDEYAEKYDFIKVIHKENTGANLSRLEGFKIARGEFISFPDSDDYAEPDYLEKLYNAFDNSTDIVMCSYFSDFDNNIISTIYENRIIEKKDFTKTFILPNISYISSDKILYHNFNWIRLYRKHLIKEEFFVSQKEFYSEDLLFQFYILQNAKNIRIIDKPLYHYVVLGNSLTNKYTENILEKYIKRNKCIDTFCKKNNILLESDRYSGLIKNTVLFSVRNAKRSGSVYIFVSDCKNIRNYYINNKENIHIHSFKEFLIINLLKLKLYKLLFKIMR